MIATLFAHSHTINFSSILIPQSLCTWLNYMVIYMFYGTTIWWKRQGIICCICTMIHFVRIWHSNDIEDKITPFLFLQSLLCSRQQTLSYNISHAIQLYCPNSRKVYKIITVVSKYLSFSQCEQPKIPKIYNTMSMYTWNIFQYTFCYTQLNSFTVLIVEF